MTVVHRVAATVGAVLVVWGGVGCGDSSTGDVASGGEPVTALGSRFPLPFGLVQLDGTEPIGRPAVYEHTPFTYNGVAVEARSLLAAYRVTADDPLGVLRAWVAQLGNGLALDQASIRAGGDPHSPWLAASAHRSFRPDQASGDDADLQLWATDDAPILLVSVSRVGDEAPRSPSVEDDAGTPPRPDSVVDPTPRNAGDVLFTEQGDEVHLPAGTWSLMPTIPTFGGTGGSTSVLAGDDGEAAVQAVLDEAITLDDDGQVTGPEVATTDGTEIVTGGFDISAGGWGFDVVSIQAPDDPHATIYVTSYAD